MRDVIDQLIYLNLNECREVKRELEARIKLLEERERLAKQLTKKLK